LADDSGAPPGAQHRHRGLLPSLLTAMVLER
jgi:hypothetical protein